MNTIWKDRLKADPTDWLLASNPWTRYRSLIDFCDEDPSSPEVGDAFSAMDGAPLINDLFMDAGTWFPKPLKRHDDASTSHYQLRILTDFGYDLRDPRIRKILDSATSHMESGFFAIRQELPRRGKSEKEADPWQVLPCDATILSSLLYRLGDRSDALMQSIGKLLGYWSTDVGWFCHTFFVEGQFKKHQAGCQMAGLQALELFSHLKEPVDESVIQHAYAPLRYHDEYGKSLYYFGRGKRFWSFKYPYVWYNALYLGDVLSRFPSLREEPLVRMIIDWIIASQDEEGKFTPTSMFRSYREWDFSNKKEPSPWITYLCCRILKQYYS